MPLGHVGFVLPVLPARRCWQGELERRRSARSPSLEETT
jgi:hypothetical protein